MRKIITIRQSCGSEEKETFPSFLERKPIQNSLQISRKKLSTSCKQKLLLPNWENLTIPSGESNPQTIKELHHPKTLNTHSCESLIMRVMRGTHE